MLQRGRHSIAAPLVLKACADGSLTRAGRTRRSVEARSPVGASGAGRVSKTLKVWEALQGLARALARRAEAREVAAIAGGSFPG